ncbi:AMP-binding protein [Ralstonia solanacearum]|uniref:AMP-binding protein n=1 Tax=Ralstonia solanacearum TaxID=305 RepID=UPI001FFC21C8|nr:AMP-binding protein [Ralstonia solanacearum]MDB0525976.1 AMP-binding protein [Ralstonia solanacearum]
MTTAAERSRLANRIRLPSYLEGVPAEIDPDRYRSLAEVLRASVQKYRNRTAYVGIGTEMTYGECEALAAGHQGTLQPVPLGPQDIAFLQYTGDTTGVAKAAMLTHRNIVANLPQTEAWSRGMLSGEAETHVTLPPLYHLFSLTLNLLMFMAMGGRNILIANPRDTRRGLFILRRERFSGIAGVNTLFNALLENPEFARRDFSAMKLTIGGGMAVQQAIAQRWKQVTDHTIVEGHGLTECSPVVTMNPPDITELTGSIGLPAPSTEVRFVRDDGTLAPVGEPGELQVRGPQVMRGCWQHAEETARVIGADGWLATGDIGVMDARGDIRLIDRTKDMILVSGFNVYPNEIEDVVALHPDGLEVAAIGMPDPVAGERVKVIVVPRGDTLTEAALLAHCRAHLTDYKVPRFIALRREALPNSAVGKILRRALRDSDPDIQRARAARP